MSLQAPDFARLGPPHFEQQDLIFLFEHFPAPGVDAVEAARRVLEQPSTLESLLESEFVFSAMHDRRVVWLGVSPRLYFNVLLRRSLSPDHRRDAAERQAIHYLANLLALFVHTERLYQVQPHEADHYEYLVDLVQQAASADSMRGFLVQSHIGNYAMFLSGVCSRWIENRHRYRRRPQTLDYYRRMGRSYYACASKHWLAERFGVNRIFGTLASRFEYFRSGLQRMPVQLTG